MYVRILNHELRRILTHASVKFEVVPVSNNAEPDFALFLSPFRFIKRNIISLDGFLGKISYNMVAAWIFKYGRNKDLPCEHGNNVD